MPDLKKLTYREKLLIYILSCLTIVFIYLVYVRADKASLIKTLKSQIKDSENLIYAYESVDEDNLKNIESLDNLIYIQNQNFNMTLTESIESFGEDFAVTESVSQKPIRDNITELVYKDSVFVGQTNIDQLSKIIELYVEKERFIPYLEMTRETPEYFEGQLTFRDYTDANIPLTGLASSANKKTDVTGEEDNLLDNLYNKSNEKETTAEPAKDNKVSKGGSSKKTNSHTKASPQKKKYEKKNESPVKPDQELEEKPKTEDLSVVKEDIQDSKLDRSDSKYLEDLEYLQKIIKSKYISIEDNSSIVKKELYPMPIFDRQYFISHKDDLIELDYIKNFEIIDDTVHIVIDDGSLDLSEAPPVLSSGAEMLYLEYLSDIEGEILLEFVSDKRDLSIRIDTAGNDWEKFYVDLPRSMPEMTLNNIEVKNNLDKSMEVKLRNVVFYESQS